MRVCTYTTLPDGSKLAAFRRASSDGCGGIHVSIETVPAEQIWNGADTVERDLQKLRTEIDVLQRELALLESTKEDIVKAYEDHTSRQNALMEAMEAEYERARKERLELRKNE